MIKFAEPEEEKFILAPVEYHGETAIYRNGNITKLNWRPKYTKLVKNTIVFDPDTGELGFAKDFEIENQWYDDDEFEANYLVIALLDGTLLCGTYIGFGSCQD